MKSHSPQHPRLLRNILFSAVLISLSGMVFSQETNPVYQKMPRILTPSVMPPPSAGTAITRWISAQVYLPSVFRYTRSR